MLDNNPINDDVNTTNCIPSLPILGPMIDSATLLWSEVIPGGAHCSYLVKRGTTIRFIDQEGGANLAAVMYHASDRLERLNLPDTLKAQHTAHLTSGHVLYSDMGRILASVTVDTVGWHDPLGGVADGAMMRAKYGVGRYQEQRNAMQRNGKESLLVEIGKWGLGLRDLAPNINLFSKVQVDALGRFQFVPGHSRAGAYVELRFEMDTLLALSGTPHPLDPAPDYAPKAVALLAWRSGPAPQFDPCRLSCAENQRGFHNTERIYPN